MNIDDYLDTLGHYGDIVYIYYDGTDYNVCDILDADTLANNGLDVYEAIWKDNHYEVN